MKERENERVSVRVIVSSFVHVCAWEREVGLFLFCFAAVPPCLLVIF